MQYIFKTWLIASIFVSITWYLDDYKYFFLYSKPKASDLFETLTISGIFLPIQNIGRNIYLQYDWLQVFFYQPKT